VNTEQLEKNIGARFIFAAQLRDGTASQEVRQGS
jgi:hypothetical protein